VAKDFRPAYGLLDFYKELYSERYGRAPTINKYRDKWGASDVCEEVGLKEAKLLLSYYFRTQTYGHPLITFFANYDVLAAEKKRQEADNERIKQIMKETEKRVKGVR
jgi:hypothetical protein